MQKLFENTVKYSFNTFKNYETIKTSNGVRKSGLQESYTYNNNFLKNKIMLIIFTSLYKKINYILL